VGGDPQSEGPRRLRTQRSRQSNWFWFGSARGSSDPFHRRHARGSLGRRGRQPPFLSITHGVSGGGGSSSPHPCKRGWGVCRGPCAGGGGSLGGSTKPLHGGLPRVKAGHQGLVPSRKGVACSLSPFSLHGEWGEGECTPPSRGVQNSKRIGTAGVVHTSLLGVKSYD